MSLIPVQMITGNLFAAGQIFNFYIFFPSGYIRCFQHAGSVDFAIRKDCRKSAGLSEERSSLILAGFDVCLFVLCAFYYSDNALLGS